MKKFKTIAFCLCGFACSIFSSGQPTVRIQKKVLASPNVTSHIFQFPINTLRDTLRPFLDPYLQMESPFLKQVFYHYNDRDSIQTTFKIITANDSAHRWLVGDYFKMPNTENDIVLHSYVSPWDSPLYYWKKKPLPYIASFILKLKSIDKDQTLLTIEPQNPEIYLCTFYWTQCTTCGIDVMDLRTRDVKPTTIEEHALLQYIADKLGDHTVEPLKLPQAAFVKGR
ncbi:MAG: hypothetical protein ABI691_21855 [Ginsengibacter sp.]